MGRSEAIANLYDWFAAATLTPDGPATTNAPIPSSTRTELRTARIANSF
jgi:hypothetical protein